jgi:hypothetical protein
MRRAADTLIVTFRLDVRLRDRTKQKASVKYSAFDARALRLSTGIICPR